MPSHMIKHSALAVIGLLSSIQSFVGADVDYSKLDYHGPYFVLGAGAPLVSERVDPVISPGQSPSNHVHEIYGADKFSADWTYEEAQTSQCNNVGPITDHSNYWFPALYFHGADETFTKINPKLKVYYHFDLIDNKPRTMFPKGFKIIAGSAMLRHDDESPSTRSIKWFCHGDPDKVNMGTFPKDITACPTYPFFAAEIWFPFCWDGIDEFDPKDPLKHVVYGDDNTAVQGGKCPSSHSKPLPQLFMEFHYDVTAVAGKPQAKDPWVLAPGDPTGLAVHADFINGWEDGPGSLKDAIAVDPANPAKTKCNAGVTAGGLETCFEMLSGDVRSNCNITPVVDEEVNGPLPQLPGCNPIQPGGAADATVQTSCGDSSTGDDQDSTPPDTTEITDEMPSKSSQSASSSSVASKVSSPSETGGSSGAGGSPSSIAVANGEEWIFQGCFSDLVPDRSIRALDTWGTGATSTDCAKHCIGAGFKIAGTEYGGQCFCGNALQQSKKLEDGACDMRCHGSGEICGGSGALSVYAKQGTSLGLMKKRDHKKRHLNSHRRSNLT